MGRGGNVKMREGVGEWKGEKRRREEGEEPALPIKNRSCAPDT